MESFEQHIIRRMQRFKKCYLIALPKKREPKNVHSIIRIDYIPGHSDDNEHDNLSLEKRKNLGCDLENVSEHGIH